MIVAEDYGNMRKERAFDNVVERRTETGKTSNNVQPLMHGSIVQNASGARRSTTIQKVDE